MAYGTARVVAWAHSEKEAENLVRNYVDAKMDQADNIGQTLAWLPIEYDDETERFGRLRAGDKRGGIDALEEAMRNGRETRPVRTEIDGDGGYLATAQVLGACITVEDRCYICKKMMCLGCQNVGLIQARPQGDERICCRECHDTFRELMPDRRPQQDG